MTKKLLYDKIIKRVAPRKPSLLMTPYRPQMRRAHRAAFRNIPMSVYETAMNSSAYGPQATAQMGDLFNDIMGAVVPGWDKRPDWMKKIQVKPDPARIVQSVQQVIPPKEAGRVLQTVNRYGFDLAYKTPTGAVPITPEMLQSGYSNLPMISRVSSAISAIPWWVYVAGGGLVLVVLLKK